MSKLIEKEKKMVTHCFGVMRNIRNIKGFELTSIHYTADGMVADLKDAHGELYQIKITPK